MANIDMTERSELGNQNDRSRDTGKDVGFEWSQPDDDRWSGRKSLAFIVGASLAFWTGLAYFLLA